MGRSRKKESAKNFIVSILLQIAMVVFGFLIPQLFLRTYGAEIHGLTSIITNIKSYMALVSAGLSTAAIQALYSPLGKNDLREVNAVLNAIGKLYNKIGIIYSTLLLIVAAILPLVIGNQVNNKIVILLMLVMGLTGALEFLFQSKYRTLLQADQKLYVINTINLILIIITGLIQAILIIKNVHVVFVQFVPVIITTLRIYFLRLYTLKNYNYLNRSIKPNFNSLSQRWAAFAHQIAGLIVNSTPVLLLIVFTKDLVMVSIYSIYQLVFSQLYTIMTSIFMLSTVASFGQLKALEEINIIKTNYNRYEFINNIVITILYSVTAVMLLPFVSLYTRSIEDVQYVDTRVAILFLIIGLANSLRVSGGTLINAWGHYKETQNQAIIEAIINISVAIVLIQYYGLYGVLMGSIASFAYRTFDIIVYSNKVILKQKYRQTLVRAIRVISIVIINFLLINLLLETNSDTWSLWIVKSLLATIISTISVIGINYFFEPKLIKDIYSLLIKTFIKR